jgi:dipeptide transport system permease protein
MTTDLVPPANLTPSTPLRSAWRGFAANRGALAALCIFVLMVVAAIGAGIIAPHDPIEQARDHLLTPPAWDASGLTTYLLGTDELGRDLVSRLLYGGRISLGIAFASVLLSTLPGVALGLTAAFFPKVVGNTIMRIMDIMLALPGLLLAMCVVAILGPGLINTVIAIAISTLPNYARLARAAALAEMPREYVTASRVAGAGPLRLMFITVLPNCMAPLIVQSTLGFSSAIIQTAALGFLGLGVQPPMPEWGTMLASARAYTDSAPWVVTVPGLTILVAVLAVNLIGDGLRDALDPKLKQS